MPIIVISYRRKDSNDISRSIYHRLVERYGERSVYIDINSIQPSADFRVHIRRTLERALVVLAVIGNEWSGPRESGAARIFDLDDPVRVEVETTLSSRRAVMPVLVNGARMPTEADVPGSLKPLLYLHAAEVRSGDDFSSDFRRLCRAIDRLTAAFWTLYVFAYLLLPFALLLLCYYLLLIKFDLDPLYLRAAVAVIATALGIGLCFQAGFRSLPAFMTGAAVGLASVFGMLLINTALGNQGTAFDFRDIIPSIARDWQEVIEYLAIIAVGTLAANALAWAFRERRHRLRS
jgi:TIR domain